MPRIFARNSKYIYILYIQFEIKCIITIIFVFDCFLFRNPQHYKLAMHVFGLLACCTTLREMDEVLSSSSVLFCSPCSGPNVAKHYRHLQLLLQQRWTFDLDEKNIIAEDYKVLNVNIRGKKSVHGLTFVMHLVYCIIKTNQTRSDELNATHVHQDILYASQFRLDRQS